MSLWRLVIREILHRRIQFALAVVSVAAPVAALVGSVTLLRAHDLRTDQIVREKQGRLARDIAERRSEAEKRAAELNEAFRTIMLRFGYNLRILPAEEDIVRYEVQQDPSAYMDEQAVRRLSESGIMTVRHLLPVLQQKRILIFGDQRREVLVVGTRGEVPLAHRAPKQPLLARVPPGKMVVGHKVHEALGLKVGSKVKAVDREFEVARIREARGDREDVSVWIDLEQAQELLGKPGKISGIFALSCVCSHAELEDIKKEIVRLLPGTRVHVKRTDAVIRYEARARAAEEAKASVRLARMRGAADIERERESRAALRGQIEGLARWLAPVLIVAGAAAVALLMLLNVRQRRVEIGILRALGLRSRKLLALLLVKALLVGLLGTFLGYLAGFGVASSWAPEGAAGVFEPALLVGIVVVTPTLSALACWAPALLASRQDPAVVLGEQ